MIRRTILSETVIHLLDASESAMARSCEARSTGRTSQPRLRWQDHRVRLLAHFEIRFHDVGFAAKHPVTR
ncbi:MAG: hypothetical protein OXI41_03350 [Chloroflexota bacterium]|nr:hypothetical protein [Chloroflexota bacterium]MDE2895706.1 hypothetical protein [Chloroflexota bacterium]